jgi:hypothetical protein
VNGEEKRREDTSLQEKKEKRRNERGLEEKVWF